MYFQGNQARLFLLSGFGWKLVVLENHINFRSMRRLVIVLGIILTKVKFGGFREFP
jgi:hypothetical protein